MHTYRILTILFATLVLSAAMMFAQNEQPRQSTEKPKGATMQSAETKGNPVVLMKTSLGQIKIELFQDKAPVSVKNFLSYVDEKFFDNTVFHRVMKNFMIQGGGFQSGDPVKQKKTKAPIINESTNGLSNDRGTLAMARTSDPNSATTQFFINVVDNKNLNRGAMDPNGYAVFGKVVDGKEVVDKIKKVPTGNSGGHQNVPTTPVVIQKVERV